MALDNSLSTKWQAPDEVEAASCRFIERGKRQDSASTLGVQPPLISFFDPEAPVEELFGNLPHWRQRGATYFVTFRLADSLPQGKLQQWVRERDAWFDAHPK